MSESTLMMESPVGRMRLVSDGAALTKAYFVDADVPSRSASAASDLLIEVRRQLIAYFAGTLRTFDLPLAPQGTDFQHRVWNELRQIPFGTTVSYGQVAERLGMSRGASRAVGLANGANPIGIIVPCHRVVGANGRLVGFAGGLPRKRFLLTLEATMVLEANKT